MELPALAEWHELVAFYYNLTLHVVPGPRSLSYFIPFILVIVALLTPPRLLSRKLMCWLVLPLVIAVQLHVWIKHKSFDVISSNGLLTAFMFLGWYDVRKDFRYVRRLRPSSPVPAAPNQIMIAGKAAEGDSSSATTDNTEALYWLEPYPSTLVSRVRWIGILLSSMRLTDWHIGVPSHDLRQPAPVQPFWKFVRETVIHGGLAYILLDFTSPYMMLLASEFSATITIEQPLLNRIIRSLMLLAHFYAALALLLSLLPYLVSICAMFIAPSLRSNSLVSPLTWPSHLGPLSSVYSGTPSSRNVGLRAFWGIFWHQNMRYITSTPGIALASALNVEPGSKLRYIMMVMSSFLFSGIIHMGVVPPQPLGTLLGPWEMRFRVASFFWLQIVGIVIEDFVQSIARGAENKSALQNDRREHSHTNMQDTGRAEVSKAPSVNVLLKCSILTWTISFLAFAAWSTVLPVACDLGWLRMSFIPVSVSRYLLI